MKSQIVLAGRFRVFEDGKINKVFDGVEVEAKIVYMGRDKKYASVYYQSGATQKHAYVHRLVATAFIPNPNKYPQVNHIDGNTRNNAVSNLEWVTAKMNVQHAYDAGLSNPMASAVPCNFCGNFTISKDGVCPGCKSKLAKEAKEIDRRAIQRDRYSNIDLSILSPSEAKYVSCASDGMFVSEIATLYNVSAQCVSSALLYAEKKSSCGRKILKSQESKLVSLVCKLNKAKKKLDVAECAYETERSRFECAQKELVLFEQSLGIESSNQPEQGQNATPPTN